MGCPVFRNYLSINSKSKTVGIFGQLLKSVHLAGFYCIHYVSQDTHTHTGTCKAQSISALQVTYPNFSGEFDLDLKEWVRDGLAVSVDGLGELL